MRLVAAAAAFVTTNVIVVAVAVAAHYSGGAAVTGLMAAIMWSASAVVLSRLANVPAERHPLRWAILGLLLGPFVGAWLAWQVSPELLHKVRPTM